MFYALKDDSQMRATDAAAGVASPARSARPVCPKCRSGVNRVPRRFIDRLLSLVHPIHRYHCRSFVCGWEGNQACSPSESDRWEAPDANSEIRLPAFLHRNAIDAREAAAAPGPHESDTLRAETISGAPHAGAGSRDDSPIAPPARKRRTANSR
jgi:hypothetical protein